METSNQLSESIYVWNLCEYGVSIPQALILWEAGISLNDLLQCTLLEFKTKTKQNHTSLFNKIKDILKNNDSLITELNLSVYALITEGISKRFIDKIVENNLSLNDLSILPVQTICTIINTGKSKGVSIQNASKELICKYAYCEGTQQANMDELENRILDFIKSQNGVNNLFLSNSLSIDLTIVDIVVDKLFIDKMVKYTSTGIVYHEFDLNDLINTLESKQREMFILRLNGETLQYIAEKFDLTRQRVRQIIQSILQKCPTLKEDKYKEFYEKYEFTLDSFCLLYGENVMTYNYLKNRYKNGDEDLSVDEMHKLGFSDELIKKYISKDSVVVGNDVISKNRTDIIKYILKDAKGYLSIDALLSKYQAFLDKYIDIEEMDRFKISKRYLEGRYDYYGMINSYRNGFRVYEVDEDTILNLFKNIDFGVYKNMVVSTKVFFDSYQDLMSEMSIYNEYELHNIIKIGKCKYPYLYKDLKINFLRMPLIQFGLEDKYEMVRNLVYQLSPVKLSEFVEFMSEEYGFKKSSFLSYFGTNFSQYILDNMVTIPIEMPKAEELTLLKNIFTEDFYFYEDIEDILNHENMDKKYMTKIYLNGIGYKTYSTYVISMKYDSAKSYIIDMIERKAILDITDIDQRFMAITQFKGTIYEMENNLDLFRVDNQTYITLNKLVENDITNKLDLAEYAKSASKLIAEGSYFTVDSLIRLGFVEKYRDYDFNDYFYTSLFRHINNIQYMSFENNIVFKKSSESITKKGFIEEIIQNYGAVTVFDLLEFLESEYNIRCSESDIKSILYEADVYYSEYTEKIYLDYEEYLETI